MATAVPTPPPNLPRRWLAAAAVLGALALAAASCGTYRAELARLKLEKYLEISAIGHLKVTQIVQWRQERLADVRRPAESPFFRSALGHWASTGFSAAQRAQWQERLDLERAGGFADAILFLADGRPVLSTGGTTAATGHTAALVAAAIAERGAVLSDLFAGEDGHVYLDAACPVFDEGGAAMAVLVQRNDAAHFLYPLVETWPIPTDTAETYLVRREGDSVLVITPMRQSPGAALSRRYDVSLTDRPAVQAVMGTLGAFDGVDYRGEPVLADLRPVPGSQWFQVAKVDTADLFVAARSRALSLGLVGLLGVSFAAAVVASHFGRRQARLYLDLYESERRQREAQQEFRTALSLSEERYRLISRLSTDFAYSCVDDDRGRFTVDWISDAFFALTGYGHEDIAREGCWMFVVHPDDRPAATAALSRLAPGDHDTREFRVLTRGGGERWFANQMECQPEAIPGRRRLLGAVRDVTERRQAEAARDTMEAQLRHGQKMEAIGRLAGGVAHDFNNMLQSILGYTETALSQLAPGHPVRADVEEIERAARRSAELTRQLLAFARKQTIAPRVMDLNDTVQSLLKMLGRLIGEQIELRWDPAPGPALVRMDPSQLDQILANLVVNARDATPGAGTIRIETAAVEFAGGDGDEAQARAGIPPGRYTMLAVHDTGTGMDADTMARLFEPFFTTKPLGQGTGLGLSTVYGIVRQNNGYVDVTSEPGRGTSFRLYFPTAAEEHVAGPPGVPATGALGGSETILLVEDDGAILRLGTRLLGRLGYTVLAAGSPAEALDVARTHAGRIDLLVTDVVMPGMSGRELQQRLCASLPGLKCLFTSGYTADVIADHGVLYPGVHFLQKPFSHDALARKVRDALASTVGAADV